MGLNWRNFRFRFLLQPKKFAKISKRLWPNHVSIFQQKFNHSKEKKKPSYSTVILFSVYLELHENLATWSSSRSELLLSYMTKLNHYLKTPMQWSPTNLPFNSFLFKRICSGKLFFGASSNSMCWFTWVDF